MKFHLILIGLQIKYIDCTKRQIGCKMVSMSKSECSYSKTNLLVRQIRTVKRILDGLDYTCGSMNNWNNF